MTATTAAAGRTTARAGLHVYFVGHSFHMFVVRPLIYLAREAGIQGHWAEGWDMIGGSTPLQHWEREGTNEVLGRLRAQLDAIDGRHGRPVTSVVPAGEAVLRLREAVVAGELPGVERQSGLFLDPLGHATQPTVDLVTYLWFAALYHLPVDGLTTLVDAADPTSADRQRALQRIAAETLAAEPRSGMPQSGVLTG
jgi:hypothetical protein